MPYPELSGGIEGERPIVKQLLHRALHSVGLDIVRRQSTERPPQFDAQRGMLNGGTNNIVIFDVGAHHGTISRLYRNLFPSAILHAFEPSPVAFAILSNALGEDANFHPHQIALSDTDEEAKLNINHSDATNSLLPTHESAPAAWTQDVETEQRVTVATKTMDSFCGERHIDHIDILKLDVQGAEGKVLSGARGLLERGAIKAIYLEMIVAPTYVGQSRPDEIFRLMRDSGLRLVGIYDLWNDGPLLLQFDALFACSEYVSFISPPRSTLPACI